MKILLTILFLSLLSSPSWSINEYDLTYRDGIYYKKFSDVPFSGKVTSTGGKVTGKYKKGSIKNGKEEGVWRRYWANGRLQYKHNWKNGKKEGKSIEYWKNGQLMTKGSYKNDEQDGAWVFYNEDGALNKFNTGTFKNGVKISD